MLDEIEDANGPVMADRTLAYLRKAFNWYAVRDDQFNVPVVRGMARISQRNVPARASCPIRNPHHLAGPQRGWNIRRIGQGPNAYGAAAG